MLPQVLHTLKSLVFRRRAESEMDEEVRFHLERQVEQNVRLGMSPQEARRAALVELGGIEQIKEACRDQWGVRLLEDLRRDFAYGLRSLRRRPGYAAAAVLTLALGIGANAALFSVVHGVLLRRLPFRDGERVVVLQQLSNETGRDRLGFSHQELNDYREQNQTLEELVEYHNMRFTLLGRAEPEMVETGVVSANFFQFLGVGPLYGRVFLPGEDRHGAEPVLVLSHRYFQASFAGDPGVVGRTVRMNDRVHRVVGVLPPLPAYPDQIDVFMPSSSCPTRSSPRFQANRRARLLTLFGRLRPGVELGQAQADLATILGRLQSEQAEYYPKGEGFGIRAVALREELTREARKTLLLLFAATGVVLLIACANVANLGVAGLARREREMAVRAALGASKGRLLRQLAAEGMLVSLAGGAAGLLIASEALALLAAFAARFTPRAYEIRIDGTVLLFTLAVSIGTGLFFSLLPAWRTSIDLVSAVKAGAAPPAGPRGRGLRGVLVASQAGLCLLLLIAAGLLLRSLLNRVAVDPGFRAERVLAMEVNPNWSRVTNTQQFRSFFETLIEKVRRQPGVVTAAVCFRVPLNERLPHSMEFRIEGRATASGEPKPLLDLTAVSPGYFETLGIRLLRGRDFTDADRHGAPGVAVISESMARRYWRDEDPVGRRIALHEDDRWLTIVGVAADVREYGLDRAPSEAVYLPWAQNPMGVSLVIRTAMEPRILAQQIRRAVYETHPEQAVASLRTLEEIRAENLAPARLFSALFTLFAGVTLLITLTGIGAVVAVSVGQRRAEIGIRMALGASRARVVGMIVRQGMSMAAAGLCAGAVVALAMTRVLSTFLFGIEPTDPVTFVVAAALLLLVSAAACLLPAGRAALADPMVALRSE